MYFQSYNNGNKNNNYSNETLSCWIIKEDTSIKFSADDGNTLIILPLENPFG